MKVVRLSALRTGRLYPQETFLVFFWQAELTPGPSCGPKVYVNENSSDIIGNRTRDLPACSAAPKPTVPLFLLQPLSIVYLIYWKQVTDTLGVGGWGARTRPSRQTKPLCTVRQNFISQVIDSKWLRCLSVEKITSLQTGTTSPQERCKNVPVCFVLFCLYVSVFALNESREPLNSWLLNFWCVVQAY